MLYFLIFKKRNIKTIEVAFTFKNYTASSGANKFITIQCYESLQNNLTGLLSNW